MAFRFEIDRVNHILLTLVEGRVTDDSAVEIFFAIQGCSTETDASAAITDLSNVTEFDVSSDLIRRLASQGSVGDPDRPRFIVAPKTFVYGIDLPSIISASHN